MNVPRQRYTSKRESYFYDFTSRVICFTLHALMPRDVKWTSLDPRQIRLKKNPLIPISRQCDLIKDIISDYHRTMNTTKIYRMIQSSLSDTQVYINCSTN